MNKQTERTYTTSQLAAALEITTRRLERLMLIARACQLDTGPGSGHARTWTSHEALVMAVANALVRNLVVPRQTRPYKNVLPYARAVADACTRGQCPAYLIMSADDWLLIDNTPDADQRATDIVLRATRSTRQAVRVLHLRPILQALETT